MEAEIRQQPELLAGWADSYYQDASKHLSGKSFDMVLLAARGSSDNAALFGRYLVEVYLGIPVSLAAPSVFTRFGSHVRYPKCLTIGISQSGSAPDVAEVLAAVRRDGHSTLAITNTEGSRITSEAESALLLNVGTEKSVAATKTYSASLLAIYQTVRALGADLPDPKIFLPSESWNEDVRLSSSDSSGTIVRCNPSFSLGRGFGFSTSQEAALKLMECALIPCKAYSTADFEHGPKALAGYGSASIAFDGPLPDLAAQGCEIIQVPRADVPDSLQPIWQVLYGQWLALHCARARGLNPDRPQHIRKVTETL